MKLKDSRSCLFGTFPSPPIPIPPVSVSPYWGGKLILCPNVTRSERRKTKNEFSALKWFEMNDTKCFGIPIVWNFGSFFIDSEGVGVKIWRRHSMAVQIFLRRPVFVVCARLSLERSKLSTPAVSSSWLYLSGIYPPHFRPHHPIPPWRHEMARKPCASFNLGPKNRPTVILLLISLGVVSGDEILSQLVQTTPRVVQLGAKKKNSQSPILFVFA